MSAPEVAKLPIEDILRRVETVKDGARRIDNAEADAMLGLVPRPELRASDAWEAFREVAAEDMRGKNNDRIRRWRSPRIRATQNFISVIGDKPLADTANKDFTHLLGSWKRVARARGIALSYSTDGVMLRSDKEKDDVRPPFSTEWIRSKLLAPGALKGMNTDARLILLGMINTGYRPSEGAGLLHEEIRLDANPADLRYDRGTQEGQVSRAASMAPESCAQSLREDQRTQKIAYVCTGL
ncbi:hypothetical protein Q4511_13865 [Paracoccus sp. 1_MG-2023]|uniref:hypothetical protein n=1 Tax=unclassified Paracoccus (in: a-proteobacteria) TaxID=2688777 RepID=UPI001C0944A1|nr:MULTISPECIES: hypothetical protein [unclassified Paracoccus (in: a-proteobacteria)]MBU2958854.1 hypothetical protein [Paracoccus sp. C2R09]MDO6670015.1 hypothetical protein [Paracoccus sp. 1_MG-2023]